MAKIIKLPSAFVLNTKVVGVSKPNADGTSRQKIIIEHVQEGDALVLIPEPDNPFDTNAVKVCTPGQKQIGYLSKETAMKLKHALTAEVEIHTTVSWVSGKQMLGVGLRIEMLN